MHQVLYAALAFISGTAASQATAPGSPSVVSLSCVFNDNGTHMGFLLYEGEQRASYDVRETGKSFQQDAVFTPSQVIIGPDDMRKIIDRTTLGISDGLMYHGEFRVFRSGTCEVTKPPASRKF